MGLFDFFKKKADSKIQPNVSDTSQVDWSLLTGKDFEFLISGDITIPSGEYDSIMTPNSLEWSKIDRDDWVYYQVAEDEFSYSWEPPGIQMVFNDSITYPRAKAIADEIISNIKATGQEVELIVIDTGKVYKF